MMQLRVRTLDLETTDFPEKGGVPIEAGYIDSIYERETDQVDWRCINIVETADRSFFDPGNNQCSIEARATHHITDAELRGAPHHSTMVDWVVDKDVTIYVAHNAEFEKKYITIPEGSFWIDTYKVALRLHPEFDKHNNQYLRYALALNLNPELAMPPHRALPDAYTTAHILAEMSGHATLKEMALWTRELPYITKVGFGEHFGKKFTEVPTDYLRWVLSKDFPPEVHAACRRALEAGFG